MYKIAIIDDEYNILDMLSTFLEINHDVTTFENPLEALTNLEDNQYDIVLCDIMMPQMNGLDLLKKLRDKGMTTKVMMMTAFDSMDKMLQAHEYGAKHYIKKPFESLDKVESKIMQVLEK